ncbi:MAG: Bax inhibitor-1/YccA family protein, partial [Tabrizicola sp.]|nr:Bax inhibitor-1/YccA family protein [Tabrizicola sp.]
MADYQTIQSVGVGARAQIDEGLRAHMNKVYGLMSVAMVITAAAAWAIAGLATTTNPAEAVFQLSNGTMVNSFGAAIYTGPLKWLLILAPLAMVFLFGAVLNRISAAGAQLYFYVYAALIGISISSIFLVFTGASIASTVLVTAISFASLSIWGYLTKRDLSGMGTFLMMGL